MLTRERSLSINVESPRTPTAAKLIQALSAELGQRYGDDGGASSFSPADVEVSGGAFVVARLEGVAVGCGAIRPMQPGVAEIKRMFVAPAARGQGLAGQILAELESLARQAGYYSVRLETGLRQPEAIKLYRKAGYHYIPNYGQYINNPLSVCFEKYL